MVLLHKAFLFKLKPDGATIRKLARFCGCARYVYNKGLAWDKEMHEKDPSFKLSYSKLCALLPEWKKETTWLAECHSQVLQQAMKDLHGAWDEGGKNGLANSGGLRHDTTSFKESFHGHAPPPVHS